MEASSPPLQELSPLHTTLDLTQYPRLHHSHDNDENFNMITIIDDTGNMYEDSITVIIVDVVREGVFSYASSSTLYPRQ